MPTFLIQDVLTRVADFFDTSRAVVLEKVLNLAAIWLVAVLAYQLVKRVATRIVARVDDHDDLRLTAAEKRGQTIAALVRSVGKVVILTVAVLLSAAQFMSIGPLIAAGGILGLAVSFGSQSLVKDVIAGFFVLAENQFGIGDVIEAAGKSGTVERMTLRVVLLRDVRGVLHLIPNGQITTVSNLTRSWSRAIIEVGLSYAGNLDRALDVVRDEIERLRAEPAWRDSFAGESQVGVEELSRYGVTVRALLRTAPGAQWDVEREFRRRIKNRLDAEGLPFSTISTPPEPASKPEAEPASDSSPLPGA